MTPEDAALLLELRTAYQSLAAAIRGKEIGKLMEIHAPEFRFEEEWMSVTRPRWEASWSAKFAEIEAYGPVTFEIERVTADGETAIAIVCQRLFAASSEAKHERFEQNRVRDTWTKAPAGWRLARREDLGDSVFGSVEREGPEIESPTLADLAEKIRTGDAAPLDGFWEAVEGRSPLVEPIPEDATHRLVTFLWRGNAQTRGVELHGGMPSQAPKPLARLAETDLWFRTERLPADVRIGYCLAVTQPMTRPAEGDAGATEVTFVTTQRDPRNPRVFCGSSVLELPEAPGQPWSERQPDVPTGKVRDETLTSEILKEERALTLYTPPGYDPSGEPCDLLVLFDGEVAQRLVPAPVILDNLIAQRMLPPMVAVLVHFQTTRSRDLACSEPFADFLADELVPWIRARYRVTTDPRRTIVSGISLGGLMAAYCGFRHSSVFGNVHSQSGSFWYYAGWPEKKKDYATEENWLARQFAITPRLPLRFYLEVGRFEGLVSHNRHLRDVLEAKGYPVTYVEFHGGHDCLTWRGSLADGLIALATANTL